MLNFLKPKDCPLDKSKLPEVLTGLILGPNPPAPKIVSPSSLIVKILDVELLNLADIVALLVPIPNTS